MTITELPRFLDFETLSSCNRTCPTCIRNSYPDREAVKSWFEPHYLPIPIIKLALDQAVEMNFHGGVTLSHFNEPTMDERLPEIIALAKSYNQFNLVFFNTDGDFLTQEMATEFENAGLDRIIVSLYMAEPMKSKRKDLIQGFFKKTECIIITQSDHIPSHFSPKYDIQKLIAENIDHDCKEPATRIIINHRQQYLLCCEDLVGNFGLGKFPDISLKDYWFGPAHTAVYENLLSVGGRRQYAHCSICPKT